MTSIAVIYHSVTGTTQVLAKAALEGVLTIADVTAVEVEIQGRDICEGRFTNEQQLSAIDRADGVLFGSPTYMGSVSAQFKAFADASSDRWAEKAWAGKVAAGFTIGSNLSGDQLSTLQYLQVFANQHGMLWCSLDIPGGYDAAGLNRLGAQSGLVAHCEDAGVHPTDLLTARYLGARVAKLADKLRGDAG